MFSIVFLYVFKRRLCWASGASDRSSKKNARLTAQISKHQTELAEKRVAKAGIKSDYLQTIVYHFLRQLWLF